MTFHTQRGVEHREASETAERVEYAAPVAFWQIAQLPPVRGVTDDRQPGDNVGVGRSGIWSPNGPRYQSPARGTVDDRRGKGVIGNADNIADGQPPR